MSELPTMRLQWNKVNNRHFVYLMSWSSCDFPYHVYVFCITTLELFFPRVLLFVLVYTDTKMVPNVWFCGCKSFSLILTYNSPSTPMSESPWLPSHCLPPLLRDNSVLHLVNLCDAIYAFFVSPAITILNPPGEII